MMVASQADMGCFDFTAACAALALSKTGVENINGCETLQNHAVKAPGAVSLLRTASTHGPLRGTCGFEGVDA
jgi:hypothetical protein